jgi:hypothetical protein
MADSFSVTTEQSWFSRLFNSIKSVLFGLVLFVVAFPLLFWNEGRAVRTARSLDEGASSVVSVPADQVNAANEGKLVYVTGQATTTETLSDPEFHVSAPAIKLERRVEMYQWKEAKKSETRNKLGGGTETVTTYSYAKVWSQPLIDSGAFKDPSGHQNPRSIPAKSLTWTAKQVTLGAFTLSAALVEKLDKSEDLSVEEGSEDALPAALKKRAKLEQGGYYLGEDSAAPAIGDAKVTFHVVKPATVSIVAKQIASTFEEYQAKAGDSILLLTYGTVSADSMFKAAQDANALLTWILRAVGFFIMALGLFLIFNPLVVLASVIPFLGSILGGGAALFAGVIAASLSLVTIALAWVTYRPLLGISLLVVAGAAAAGHIYLSKQNQKAKAA